MRVARQVVLTEDQGAHLTPMDTGPFAACAAGRARPCCPIGGSRQAGFGNCRWQAHRYRLPCRTWGHASGPAHRA
jgi:hypothetical protein